MNLLLVREILPCAHMPALGEVFLRHMEEKTHPAARLASLNAWTLLAEGLQKLGEPLHAVEFTRTGKPVFKDSSLHFSLSHSGQLAAVLIADKPCAVDVEQLRHPSQRLAARCMHPAELAAGMDFFEVWTRKECIAKLDGSGMRARPSAINSMEYTGWFSRPIADSTGGRYHLSAICLDGEEIHFA